jgi:hypothetical protein
MRNSILLAAAASAFFAPAGAFADNQTPTDKDKSDAETKAPPIIEPARTSRFYGSLEYLYWWVKPAPLSVPLVSSGTITETHHGLLGVPAVDAADSSVLYGAPHSPATGGNNSQAFPGLSGGRLTAGFYLCDDERLALEAGGFSLQRGNAGFSVRGDSDGNPVMGVPVYNSVTYDIGSRSIFPGEDSLPFSLPNSTNRARGNGVITGGIVIKNSIDFWGASFNGVFSLYRKGAWEVSGVAGVRYLDLQEDFSLVNDIEGVSGPYTGQSGVVSDNFSTKNRFYGANFGLRGKYTDGPWTIEATGLVAPGLNQEVQEVGGGFYSYNFTASYDYGPEGIFAQPANEGRTSSQRFCIVPELQFKIGYALTKCMKVTVGYDFLYMSTVIRPTDQIDRNLPKGQTFNQADPTISTESPSKKFTQTDFYAQGFSFGLEFTF